MTDHRELRRVPRVLVIVSLVLLLLIAVIGSVKYETDSGKTVDEWHKEHPEASAQQLININTASLEELLQLEDMGEVTAQRIIEYRERFVRFTSIKELANVKGIDEADIARWEPYITV